jgi:hypothetical protein
MLKQTLLVPSDIAAHLKGDVFAAMMGLSGKAFRDVPGRKTMQVEIGGKYYFIKQHVEPEITDFRCHDRSPRHPKVK